MNYIHNDEELRCDESPLHSEDDSILDEDEPGPEDFDDLDAVWSPLFATTNHAELQVLISNMLQLEQDPDLLPAPRYVHTFQDERFDADREAVLQEAVQMESAHFLSPATTTLGISLFDRFFSKYLLEKTNRWLIVLALRSAMHIACKMEDKHVPTFEELQDFSEQPNTGKFPAAFGAKMESLILNTLEWRTAGINVVWFVDRLLLCLYPISEQLKVIYRLSLHLVRQAILESAFLKYRPSCVAAACTLYVISQNQELSATMGLQLQTVEHRMFFLIGCQVEIKECRQQVEDMLIECGEVCMEEDLSLDVTQDEDLDDDDRSVSPVSVLAGPSDKRKKKKSRKEKARKLGYAEASPPKIAESGAAPTCLAGIKRPRATVGGVDMSALLGDTAS